MRKIMMAAALALGTATIAAPVSAQQAGGLITVQVTNVDILRNSLNNNDVDILNNLLNNNQLIVSPQVPVNVQVPIGIAANVCGTTVLALQDDPDATCTATSASRAFGQAIAKQVLEQRSGK